MKDISKKPRVGVGVMEPDEIIEWRWFDLDSLPHPIFPPSEKILKEYFSAQKNT